MADLDKRPLSGSYIQIGHIVSSTATCRVPMIKYPMHKKIENIFTLWTTRDLIQAGSKRGGTEGLDPLR